MQDESVNNDIESTTHPVETGIEIESTVRKKPTEISLSGKIVDYDGTSASEILSKLKEFQSKGSLLSYSGRNTAQNLQIQSFNTTHPNTNAGGADFSMTLREVRIAKSSYTSTSNNTTANKKTEPDLSVGSTVVFKGGSVYVSSDATTAAANRGRSTCEITQISTKSWSIHQYHLISTDGKMVYGWVDESNIEGITSNGTAATTNGGTQQTQSGSGTEVYHVVKSGETVWGLVNTTYKSYGLTCQELINNNPSAFSKQGDATTLQVGAKLYISKKASTVTQLQKSTLKSSAKNVTSSSGSTHVGGGGGF